MERSEVNESYKWSIQDVFADDAAWERAFAQLEEKLDFEKYRGTLNKAERILTYFKEEEEIGRAHV